MKKKVYCILLFLIICSGCRLENPLGAVTNKLNQNLQNTAPISRAATMSQASDRNVIDFLAAPINPPIPYTNKIFFWSEAARTMNIDLFAFPGTFPGYLGIPPLWMADLPQNLWVGAGVPRYYHNVIPSPLS